MLDDWNVFFVCLVHKPKREKETESNRKIEIALHKEKLVFYSYPKGTWKAFVYSRK